MELNYITRRETIPGPVEELISQSEGTQQRRLLLTLGSVGALAGPGWPQGAGREQRYAPVLAIAVVLNFSLWRSSSVLIIHTSATLKQLGIFFNDNSLQVCF